MIKSILKYLARFSPIAFTKNQQYDRQTEHIIKQLCKPGSICIDVGANNGTILAMMIKYAPKGMHYAFEPIPSLYHLLVRKYGSAAKIFRVALSDTTGKSPYNHVLTNPAYSGLQKRRYDRPEKDELITVNTGRLDSFIKQKITLIKMDVEGGEYNVLLGAEETIRHSQPVVLFEFGKSGAETYEITAYMMFYYFADKNYGISLLHHFLHQHPAMTLEQFQNHCNIGDEYFFVAYPLSLLKQL